jgi:hypothetical protein
MNANPGAWNTNAKIVASKTSVESLYAAILSDAGIQESEITGTTVNKDNTWVAAEVLALHVCTGLRAYADDTSNTILYNMMHYKKTDLLKCEVQDALTKMNLIYNQAIAVPIATLTPFNITAADLTNFNTALQAFTTAVPQHGVLQAARKTSTENIKSNFKLLRAGGKKLNTLVQTLKLVQANFVQTYDNSCIIVNLGHGQMSEEVHLMPLEHVAMFTQKFLPTDTFTIRNHSEYAKIRVYLADNTNLPTTGGIEIGARSELKMEVPTAFKTAFGHILIVVNEATMDDAHVTVVLAHGKSQSGAATPTL